MDVHRTARLAELFGRALEMPSAERMGFVQAVSGEDAELRQELMSLLEAHDSSGAFFDALAAEVVSPACAALVEGGSPVTESTLRPELEAALPGRYRLQQELGGGSMSRVFLAEEIRLGRKVVIKVLPPQLTVTMSGDRFRREIQLAAQLQHPHIVPVLTSESIGRLLYYSMPYIAGESLRARLTRDGPLPVREALSIWRDVLDALAHAHAARVVHRDIKPGNILLTGRNALVSDFGIAQAIEAAAEDAALTAPGITLGTPAYMAPEQATGDPRVDPRADIYAAGLVMFEMLEGRRPFAGGSSRDVMRARLDSDPLPIARPDCPPELAALVQRCLARDPIRRPANADDILAELETLPGGGSTRPRWSPWRRALTYGLVLAGISAGVLAARSLLGRAAEAPSAAPAPASIAILPLTNLSTDANDAALAEGMTEELNATLSRGSILRVVASTSVRALKDRQLDVRQIAESLRVSHFLEGAVQKVGSQLRLQVRLVDARDGSTRWSETYDRHIGDIFAVQDDIARAVAGELDARLASGAGAVSRSRRYSPSLIAYEAYLRGTNSVLRTSAGRREGIEHFKEAIAADPGFAAAHAGLVWLYLLEAGSAPGDHQEWNERAEQAARNALALDETLAEAHSALGWARMAQRDFTTAEIELKRAIAIDPSVHRGYEGLARVYMLTWRPAEQLAAARRGLEIEPFSAQAIREMALALNMNNRCDETLELLRPLKDLKPPAGVAGVIRGQCFARKQMWPEAIAEFRWAMETSDARAALAFLGYALARGGRTDEARSILSDLLSGRKNSHGAFGVAVVYTGLREYDQAFVRLEQAMEENSWRGYLMAPLFEDLHRDPRFARLRMLLHAREPTGTQKR